MFNKDECAVMQFLTGEGCKDFKIHRRILTVCGANCLSKLTVTYLSEIFCSDPEKTAYFSHLDQVYWVVNDIPFADINIVYVVQEISKGTKVSSHAMDDWFKLKPKLFFAVGILHLPKQCNSCLNTIGDFVQRHVYNAGLEISSRQLVIGV